MIRENIVAALLRIPVLNSFLRKMANKFQEGSIIAIKSGVASGMLWKRYHRYVNGYWAGIYELQIQQRIALELKEGDTFFDIGANAGFFSLVAARIVGHGGRVIAFEPLPMNSDVIEEQFAINKLKQCQCVHSALGARRGEALLILPRSADGNPSTSMAHLSDDVLNFNEGDEMGRYRIEINTLNFFCDNFKTMPELVKIDVEGAEGDVLRGAMNLLLSDKAPRIIIETHGIRAATDVNDQLRDAGYRFYSISGAPLRDGLTERHYLAYPPSLNRNPETI